MSGNECRKRILQLLGEKKAALAQVEELQAKVDSLTAELAEVRTKEAERDKAAEAARAEQLRQFGLRLEAFKKECPDFDEVVGAADLKWPQCVVDLLTELPNGPELTYRLALHGREIYEDILHSSPSVARHKIRKLAFCYEMEAEARKNQEFREAVTRETVTSIYQRERQALDKEKRWRN